MLDLRPLLQQRLRHLAHPRSLWEALTQWVRASWPVLVILAVPVLLLSPSLFGGHAATADDTLFLWPPWSGDLAPARLVPQNALLSDGPLEIDPWLFLTHQALTAGRFPFWNATVAGGTPFFAASLPAVLYPLTWLEALLPYPLGLTLGALLRWWGVGLGMYVFARSSLKLARLSAVVSALSFMLGSFWVVWLIHQLSWAVMLLPWLLWATERVIRRPSARRVGVLALLVGLVGLTGQPEMSLHVTLGGGLYALWLVGTEPARSWLARARSLGRVGGGYLLGILLAAIQYLPTLLQIPLSQTPLLRGQGSPSHPLPLSGLFTWLVPDSWGSPVVGSYWGPTNYNEDVFYAGAVALALACVGVLSLRRRDWRRERVFFLLLVLVFGTLLYGLPPGSWLTSLPVLHTDLWNRLGVLAILGISGLAGYGCETMLAWGTAASDQPLAAASANGGQGRRAADRHKGMVVVGSLALLLLILIAIDRWYRPAGLDQGHTLWVLFWLDVSVLLVGATSLVLALRWRGWVNPRIAGALILLLLLFDQLPFAAPYTPQPSASLAFPVTPTIVRLQHTVGSERMAAAGWILPPDSGTAYGLHDLRGYDPLASARYLKYMLVMDPSLEQSPITCCRVLTCPSLTLLSMASVAYYATLPEVDANRCARLSPGQGPTPGPLIPLWTQGGLTLWQNTLVRPRFYFADQIIPSSSETQTLAALPTLSAGGRDAIIEGAPATADAATTNTGAISVVTDLPGEITLQTQTDAAQWLIVDEGYDTGWQADVDGLSTAIHPANEMFQAVYVPVGAHTIHLIYRPRMFWLGASLSALALLILLGLLLGEWTRRRFFASLPERPNGGDTAERAF